MLREGIITYKGQRCGTLRETAGGGTLFAYDDAWGSSIACALPVDARVHPWAEGLHPFFQHLGPEGWLRDVQAKASAVEADDDFGLLLAHGADCIGAVGIERPPGESSAIRHLPRADEEAAASARRTVSGVQRKLLTYHDGRRFVPAQRPGDPATHIAKFNDASESTLVWNENLTLTLARRVLGDAEVTKADLGQVEGIDGVALLVERFDRDGAEKLRLEDFAQIALVPRGRDYKGKYRASFETAAGIVARHSARPLIDLERFFRRVVFSVLVGNADAHLKNFSLLETPGGLRLSPAYDLLNTVVYAGRFDEDTALALGGDYRPLASVRRAELEAFGRTIGLPPPAIDGAFSKIRRGLDLAKPLLALADDDPAGFRARYAQVVDAAVLRIFP